MPGFSFAAVLITLLWAVIAVLNFWIWRKAKASGNLCMFLGGAWMTLASLLGWFGVSLMGGENFAWSTVVGLGLMTVGFYLSVKPMVSANIAHLQAKVKSTIQDTMGKKGSPVSGPPPSGTHTP